MLLFFPIPAVTRTLLIALITGLVLVGIMIRPWKTNEAIIALAGAGLLLLLGLITPANAFFTLVQDWNTFFFFLGMMSLSALAETAGFFDWLAAWAARLSGNSVRRLFLTPIIYSLTTRLRLPVLPYLFACTFIADTASFLLPVSNPINIIVLSTFQLDLWTFLRLLLLPGLLVIGTNVIAFFL